MTKWSARQQSLCCLDGFLSAREVLAAALGHIRTAAPALSAHSRNRGLQHVNGGNIAGQIIGDASGHGHLAVILSDQQDHTGADVLLVRINQPAQIFARNSLQRLGQELVCH